MPDLLNATAASNAAWVLLVVLLAKILSRRRGRARPVLILALRLTSNWSNAPEHRIQLQHRCLLIIKLNDDVITSRSNLRGQTLLRKHRLKLGP